jgi:hypothetical protein
MIAVGLVEEAVPAGLAVDVVDRGLGSEGDRDGGTGGGGGGGYSGHHYYDLNLFISFILWIKLKFKNVKITIKIFYTIYSHKTIF